MAWETVWENVFSSQEWGKYPPESIIRFVARNYYKTPNRSAVKLLEVGCGPGANLWFMAREGFSVYGIDGSASAIALAKARLDGECPGWQGELLVGDMEKLPYENDFFDGVIDNEAISTNPDENALAMYHEMWRVTKSGGKLFSKTFASGCVGEGTGRKASGGGSAWFPEEGPLTTNYTRFTTLEDVPRLLKDWNNREVNIVSYTVGGVRSGKEVREWVMTAEK